jgi:hypothetical protein
MLTEREQARTGPRALKPVGSPEWCWQTLDFFKDALRHVDEQYRQAEEVLEELQRAKAWEKVPPEAPYGSLDAMLRAETGMTAQQLRQLADRLAVAHLPPATSREDRTMGRSGDPRKRDRPNREPCYTWPRVTVVHPEHGSYQMDVHGLRSLSGALTLVAYQGVDSDKQVELVRQTATGTESTIERLTEADISEDIALLLAANFAIKQCRVLFVPVCKGAHGELDHDPDST